MLTADVQELRHRLGDDIAFRSRVMAPCVQSTLILQTRRVQKDPPPWLDDSSSAIATKNLLRQPPG